jgi:hypothetical protein
MTLKQANITLVFMIPGVNNIFFTYDFFKYSIGRKIF